MSKTTTKTTTKTADTETMTIKEMVEARENKIISNIPTSEPMEVIKKALDTDSEIVLTDIRLKGDDWLVDWGAKEMTNLYTGITLDFDIGIFKPKATFSNTSTIGEYFDISEEYSMNNETFLMESIHVAEFSGTFETDDGKGVDYCYTAILCFDEAERVPYIIKLKETAGAAMSYGWNTKVLYFLKEIERDDRILVLGEVGYKPVVGSLAREVYVNDKDGHIIIVNGDKITRILKKLKDGNSTKIDSIRDAIAALKKAK